MALYDDGDTAKVAHLARARQLAEQLGPGQFFSHETAAAFWGLPIHIAAETPLAVGSLRGYTRMRRAGVQAMSFAPDLADVTRRGTSLIMSPRAVWAETAPRLPLADAIALGDAILHRPRIGGSAKLSRLPFCTPDELYEAITLPYRRHKPLLLERFALLTPHSASAPETHLRLALTQWGFAPEALDFDVRAQNGTFLGCSEIAYPSRRLALEYEGDHHRVSRQQWHRDLRKYADYTAAGWRVLRVTAHMLYREPRALRAHVTDLLR